MRTLAYVLTILVYVGLTALVLWLFAIRPRQPLKDRIANLLQLVAAYTFMLGLMSSSGVFKAFDWLQRDLTSQDPLRFLASNSEAFSIVYAAAAVAFDPTTSASMPRFFLGLPVLLAGVVILLAYTIVHFLVIVPIAYFGYLVTSVPIDAILKSGSDIEIKSGGGVIRIRELVQQNEPAIRNFAVAVPALLTSFVLKFGSLLRPASHKQ
jgi:hypothetical protein